MKKSELRRLVVEYKENKIKLSKSSNEKLKDKLIEDYQLSSLMGKTILRFDSMGNAINFETGLMDSFGIKYTPKERKEYPMKLYDPEFDDSEEYWQVVSKSKSEEVLGYIKSAK